MKKRLISVLFIVVIWGGCKKDPSLECNPLPQTSSPIGWNYTENPNFNSAPCFNPNNPNEFVFVRHTSGTSVLCTYDMQTKTLLPLCNAQIYGKPDWGINHWILFNANNDIYKVKENGDSLTQLNAAVAAAWLPNATGYTYPGNGNYFWLASPNGQVINSFSTAIGDTTTWPDSTLILVNAGSASTGFIVYSGIHNAPKLINCNVDISSYSTACYINSAEFIWADWTGVYVTNIRTAQTSRVRSNCNSVTYLDPSYSPQSNKVLWFKETQTAINSTTISTTNVIEMMNPDGTGEQEVDLP